MALNIFATACLLFILGYFFYILYYAAGLYGWNLFHRPKALSESEKGFIINRLQWVKDLETPQIEKFFERVAWFRRHKPFGYKGAVTNKVEIELLICSAGALMTLGMKSYKFIRSVTRIVIYPSDYYSILNKKHHVGEYNVGLKTLVFAADTLQQGFAVDNDNVNLAIHEFAHALCFETHNKNSWEALRFQWGFKKLKKIHSSPVKMAEITESGYFRAYGKTSVFEFFSVLAENFVETPATFKRQYPELYALLKKMLNFEVPSAEKSVKTVR